MNAQSGELPQDIELLAGSQIKYQANWQPPAYSTGLEGLLSYVLEGAGIYELNGATCPIKAGECIWLPPGTSFAVRATNGQPILARNLRMRVMDPELSKRMKRLYPPLAVDATLASMLNYLFERRNDQEPYVYLTRKAFTRTLLSLFHVDDPHPGRPCSAYVTADEYSPATQKLLLFVEGNFYQWFSMEEIAKELGYSKNYLSTVFARDTGHPFLDYANFHRARLGCVLMFFWGVGVMETCTRLKFSYLSYFSKIFKKFVGIPPRDFYRACVSLTVEERNHILQGECILRYRPMPIDELFAALRHLGETMAEILKQKAQPPTSNDSDLSES